MLECVEVTLVVISVNWRKLAFGVSVVAMTLLTTVHWWYWGCMWWFG